MTFFEWMIVSSRWKFLSIITVIYILSCNSGPSPQEPGSPTEAPKAEQVLETDTGLASYYGPGLEGNKTASGETFDSQEMVAAHPSYPMGTILRVTNLENGDTVRVRISDFGPTKKNRKEGIIIDLSKGAASKINMVSKGKAQVKVEVLTWGKDSLSE
jgi:rare lipoprotein A